MSDIIKLLPDSVANQIAAGEVIQRPASVIKELVENSIDAGATDIRIIIRDAGRTLIQVVDNGKGMSSTDARMAFERHATSKIIKAEDLFSLMTMGFRGEALPSICAISKVELKTRQPSSTLGTKLEINASKVENQESVMCDAGTNIMVKNLFFNVPARRKFLKSDGVETSNIMREFERLALVNNNIRMSIDTGGKVIELRAATFHQRIADLWKNALDLHLIPIDVDTTLIKISGYVSRPEYARRRNPLQYLIVNGRNMRHPYFHKAVTSCYDSLIASDTQPCYFLKFEVEPSTIDVNIHPTKNEIKFEYEQEIWPIIQASVKAALGKYSAIPSIDFNSDVLPVDPLPEGEKPIKPTLDLNREYNPFREKSTQFDYKNNFEKRMTPKNWNLLFSQIGDIKSDENDNREGKPSLPGMTESESVGAVCIQHDGRYIVTSLSEGLVIINQRRAHIKILFEQYLHQIRHGENISQGIMFPETVTLDLPHQEAFETVQADLLKIGFNLEYDEDNKWRIIAIPAILKNGDPKDVIMKILDSVTEDGIEGDKGQEIRLPMIERMALQMAKSSAISGNSRLSGEEMEHIVTELFSLPEPVYDPYGKRIYTVIDDTNLDNMMTK